MADELVIRNDVRLGSLEVGATDIIHRATTIANDLAKVVNDRKLYSQISGRKYVRVEGWTTLGAMLGVLPREVDTRLLDDGCYESVVELIRVNDGAVIGRGSAICSADEKNWQGRDEFARRSMAITRATGKAYRLGFSWIMTLAGYEATPAEEMIDAEFIEKKAQSKPAPPPPSVNGKRPYPPDVLKTKILAAIPGYEKQGLKPSDQNRNMVAANMELCFAGNPNAEDMRHTVTLYLTGKGSTKELTDAEIVALSRWLNAKPDDGGEWHPDPLSAQEANACYTEALKVEGQIPLE